MLLVGLAGMAISEHERGCLAADQVSGVMLGARNVESREQLQQLVQALRDARPDDAFVIGMDRSAVTQASICDGFTQFPAPAQLGKAWDNDRGRAVDLAETYAWLMSSERRAADIDFVLAPFLGVTDDRCGQAGRTLHADPLAVAELGQAMVRGMRLAGMSAVPGDFPGNNIPDQAASRRDVDDARLQPFADAVAGGAEAMMMAPAILPDARGRATIPTRTWIDEVLRGELDFRGLVIADDACLADSDAAEDVAGRIHACHDAGCDLVAVRAVRGPGRIEAALNAVSGLPPCDPADVARLRGAVAATWTALEDNPQRDEFIARVQALDGEQV